MKKIIAGGGVFAAIALSGALGFFVGMQSGAANPEITPASMQAQQEDALEVFRTERQQLRQMQLAQLNELIYEGEDAQITLMAQQRQMELMDWSEKELTLEGVLEARGFQDALATVHTDSVNIMVRADSLSQQEASIIFELVTRETGISGGNVKIIPIN